MRSFMKINSSQNGNITLSFIDIGKSRPSHNLLMSQICLLTLFEKIKFSRKFPNLQYLITNCHYAVTPKLFTMEFYKGIIGK